MGADGGWQLLTYIHTYIHTAAYIHTYIHTADGGWQLLYCPLLCGARRRGLGGGARGGGGEAVEPYVCPTVLLDSSSLCAGYMEAPPLARMLVLSLSLSLVLSLSLSLLSHTLCLAVAC